MSALMKKISQFIIFVLVVFLCFQLINLAGIIGDRVNAATAKPTAIPTATAPVNDILSWVNYYADMEKGKDVVFRSAYETTSAGESILVIEYYLNPMSDGDDYRRQAARTIIDVGSKIHARKYHKMYDVINFLFYGGFIDKYGNKTDLLGIRAWYENEDFEKLNFSYFDGRIYSDPDAIIRAADEYTIHRAYQD